MSSCNNNSSSNGTQHQHQPHQEGNCCLLEIVGKLHSWLPRRRRLSFARLAAYLFAVSTFVYAVVLITDIFEEEQSPLQIQPSRDGSLSLQFQSPETPSPNNNENCTEKDKELCTFRQQMLSKDDRRVLAETLLQCSHMLNRLRGTAYFLYGTSLVGYYRHNASLIPWEDFVNIALFATDPELNVSSIVRRFHRLVKRQLNDYSIRYDRQQHIIKCYSISPTFSYRIPNSPSIFWRWPYIEIQIMNVARSESGKILQISDPVWSDFSYPAEIILPLKTATFEGVKVFVPSDALIALERNYNPYSCRSIYYSHREERSLNSKSVVSKPCASLRHFVNFTNLEFIDDVSTGSAPNCEIGKVKDDPLLCSFLPLLSREEKASVLKLMSICLEMLEELNGATYFLYGGTLIGYWRHNGSMIPWDDDVDIAVVRTDPNRNESFIVAQLERLITKHPGYAIYYMNGQSKVKCFGTTSKNSRKIGNEANFSWRWPFVDIQLMHVEFDQNNKNIVNISDTSGFDSFWYPGEMILPLKRATFELMPVWIPPDVGAVLDRNYDIRECVAPYYNHRFESVVADERQVSRPCIQLTSLYSFTNIEDAYYDPS